MNKNIEQLIIGKIQTEAASQTHAISEFVKHIPEKKRFIILIDIAGFSKLPSRQQVTKLMFFQKVLKNYTLTSRFKFKNEINIEGFIPTGDGCYMISKECKPEVALEFLVSIISVFNSLQKKIDDKFSLRVSGLLGNCFTFIDIARHKNYIGEGMNEAERVMSGGRKCLEAEGINSENTVYIDDSLAAEAEKFADRCGLIKNWKDVADKHGKKRNVTALGEIK